MRCLKRLAFVVVTFAVLSNSAASHATECGDLDSSGKIVASDALLLLKKAVGQNVQALECPACQLVDTGQSTCYGIDAQGASCAGTGQDGEFHPDAPRTFTDHGDGTITDDVTGLMWEKLSNDNSTHDYTKIYSFHTALTKATALNAASFAGHNDWRIPNLFEIETLRNLGATVGPATYTAFNNNCAPGCTVTTCSCTASGSYWSSSTYAINPTAGWLAVFNGAATEVLYGKQAGNGARAVRGGL